MTDRELEQIYGEAYKAVYWTAMALLKNEADAEDIVQDTFVSLIENYDSIADKTKVVAWLKKNAANKCLNRLTRTKTDNASDEFFETIEAVPEDFLPDSIVESEDTRKIIMNIIDNVLSDEIRRTLVLFYFDEMSTKEIAEVMGIPQGTVLWRLNFAKKRIKKEVEKYEEENNTKLYGMALPFLSKLFMKEAEQVVFKPLPASLMNLSASVKAPSNGAGIKASAEAVTKGTGSMTKILIGTIAGSVLAVGISVGLVIGVLTKKDDKKPRTTRETTIETTERHARYPDDETEYPTEPEETETTPKETEPTQRITEDSIYIGMDGMSAEEVVNNVWKTTRVKVGMTKEEYASKFVLNGKNSKANSVVDGFYWQFVLIPSSKSRIMMLTLSVPRDKQTSEITSIHDKCFVETQLSIDGVDFSKEVFEKFLEKYKSVGFKVVDDFGPTDKIPARLVILERPGFRLKISLSCSSTYKKGTVSLQIPIVND
ncbi:MAG: sigma-70 family RNA polymerase sigma factor [Clostridiales bacterium]|nr:sigma-70 family RNA polymerase sigma factor [Clostridiales bacterium]